MASKRLLTTTSVATSGSSGVLVELDVSSVVDVMILLTPAGQNLTAVSIEADAGNGQWGEYALTIAPLAAGSTSRPIELTNLAASRIRVKATAAGVGTCRVTAYGRE
jgi:hypothetical protein